MLERIATVKIRVLAAKARAARDARDRMLTHIDDRAFHEPTSEREVRDPAADTGVDLRPESGPDRMALAEELSTLPVPALRELWALVLIGRGDYGLRDWGRAMAEANRLLEIDATLFMEQPDLHEHLMRAVYELERTSGEAAV